MFLNRININFSSYQKNNNFSKLLKMKLNKVKIMNAQSDVKNIFFKKKESLKSKIVTNIENNP